MEVIKVEQLYKQYRLGQVGTGSLIQDVNRWWYMIRGKEDPYGNKRPNHASET